MKIENIFKWTITKQTTQPPKPPPVMRAPKTPVVLEAISTKSSNS